MKPGLGIESLVSIDLPLSHFPRNHSQMGEICNPKVFKCNLTSVLIIVPRVGVLFLFEFPHTGADTLAPTFGADTLAPTFGADLRRRHTGTDTRRRYLAPSGAISSLFR